MQGYWFDACTGQYFILSLGKIIDANFLTGSLCGVEAAQVVVSQWHITEKKNLKPIKKPSDMVLSVSS